RNLACYKKMNERQRASLLQFSAIFMIHEAVREIKAKKIPKPDVMNVKHEAKWQGYAYGFQSPLDYKPDWDYVSGHDLCKLNGCHVVATGPYKKYENVRFYAYSVAAGFTFSQFWPLDHLQFLKVCYALYSKEENDIPLIAPKFFDPKVIETYEKYNFLEKRKMTKGGSDETGALKQGSLEDAKLQQETFDGTFKPHNGNLYVESLNLPVLQDEDEDELFKKIYHPCILDFAEKFHSELEELMVNPVEVPKHLKNLVPEGLKYQQCGDAFVMALLYQGAWNGWYKNDYARKNEPVPALVICLGKELGEEERK
ncbi:MAG: hypothetical protein K5829_03320, partial [Treponema sp.]|nr:hypothetical protein [Treponema sp.]